MLHSSFENIPRNKKYNSLCKKKNILIVGTSKQKNIETLFHAIRGINIHLHIIGHLSDQQVRLLNDIEYTNYVNLDDESVCRVYIKNRILSFLYLSLRDLECQF